MDPAQQHLQARYRGTPVDASPEQEALNSIPQVPPAEQSEDDADALLTEERLEKLSKDMPIVESSPTPLDTMLDSLPTRWRNWVIRGIFSIIMIGTFTFLVHKGPLWLMVLVFAIQIKCFHEIISIGYAVYRVHNLPWFRVLSWWFLLTSNYYLFAESLLDYFRIALKKEEFLKSLIRYRQLIAFTMYIVGFVGFVLSLKKKYYLRQFSLFAWTHVTLVILVTQSFLIVQNIFQGMIWFLVPVSMIICNDIMAYMFGFFFGRTPLIQLSPKKTWEGFIGGALSTVVFGIMLSGVLLRYPWFVCPIVYTDDGNFTKDCILGSSFRTHTFQLPSQFELFCKLTRKPCQMEIYPFVFHALVMGLFASIIGPFGGFFASGFKRAFKIKDFGDVIPGHGGLMDRFDCQLLMGSFVNVYIASFIRTPEPSRLVQQITLMRPEAQLEVYAMLTEELMGSGLLNNTLPLT